MWTGGGGVLTSKPRPFEKFSTPPRKNTTCGRNRENEDEKIENENTRFTWYVKFNFATTTTSIITIWIMMALGGGGLPTGSLDVQTCIILTFLFLAKKVVGVG